MQTGVIGASSLLIRLSIWSVANRSNLIDNSDFSPGKLETNKRGLDINLGGDNGNVKLK